MRNFRFISCKEPLADNDIIQSILQKTEAKCNFFKMPVCKMMDILYFCNPNIRKQLTFSKPKSYNNKKKVQLHAPFLTLT